MAKLIPTSFSFRERRQRGYQSENSLDRRYHRHLWRGLDLLRPPEVYEAMRLMFVYRSSPCLAQYVVQKHTEDNIYDYLLVVAIILIQINREDKAIKARDQLRMIRLG